MLKKVLILLALSQQLVGLALLWFIVISEVRVSIPLGVVAFVTGQVAVAIAGFLAFFLKEES